MPSNAPSTMTASDSNVLSISDAQLAQRYRFIREIGAGNWGCVWQCAPRTEGRITHEDPSKRIAVKLVFREKKPTTAQRVRSLWNEMKIVRRLRKDAHPSIIPFHSFIITPSFAIITMDYLPHLIPVEVPEPKARGWFRSLLSAVRFLHVRGVVHNDIKPANILLTANHVPVFVDFGFAEEYEIGSKRAFMSNLAYGTPEYLSPERARGNAHDTRKSDIWSLGITFFEILVGRTPFEYNEGEKLNKPEDLERYWTRTVKGEWLGEWKMSPGIERLLRSMISSSADLRCTASEAMKDPYWTVDMDMDILTEKLMTMSCPPSKTPIKVRKAEPLRPQSAQKENVSSVRAKKPPAVEIKQPCSERKPYRRPRPSGLSTIEGSPMTCRTSASKENAHPPPHYALREAVMKARPAVVRKPVPVFVPSPVKDPKAQAKRTRPLADTTSRAINVSPSKRAPPSPTSPLGKVVKAQAEAKKFGSGSYDRMKAFERLKQLERSRFLMEDDDDLYAESVANDDPSKPEETGLEELEKEDAVHEITLAAKPSTGLMTATSISDMSSSTKFDTKYIPTRTFEKFSSRPRSDSTLVATKKTSRLFGSRRSQATSSRHCVTNSEDLRHSPSGEELSGFFSSLSMLHSSSLREDASKSVNAVRKAFKSILPGKSVVRRQSKAVV